MVVGLIPPDREQCQVYITKAHQPFRLGFAKPRSVRCTNKPEAIITEKEPGSDGQRGSMSVCGSCFIEFCHQNDPSSISIEKLT
jgi:hypothetical protein